MTTKKKTRTAAGTEQYLLIYMKYETVGNKKGAEKKDIMFPTFQRMRSALSTLSKDANVEIISISRVISRPLTKQQQVTINNMLVKKRWNED